MHSYRDGTPDVGKLPGDVRTRDSPLSRATEGLRLQVFLARRTGLSRRRAEDEIRLGKVLVNGKSVELGQKVVPGEDLVTWNGEDILEERLPRTWVMLHKPLQVVTTRRDEQGRETVMDLLAPELAHLYPVGRLDVMTTGLLLLSNDGDLANRLLHPRNHVPKTYQVTLSHGLPKEAEEALIRGEIELDERQLAPAHLEYFGDGCYEITIREGRNRQVRRMFEAVGAHVQRLHRIRFGSLWLEDLPCERYRELGADEVRSLEELLETK